MTKAIASRAPADRPPGKRGFRAPLAGVAALAAPVSLMFLRVGDHGSFGGSFGDLEYRLDGPAWTGTVLSLGAAGLVASAVLLWRARSPLAVAAGFALLPLAAGGALLAFSARQTAGEVTSAEARSVGKGVSRDRLTARLGAPAGHGRGQRDGERLDCLIYEVVDAARTRVGGTYVFCFAGDRLVVEESFG